MTSLKMPAIGKWRFQRLNEVVSKNALNVSLKVLLNAHSGYSIFL